MKKGVSVESTNYVRSIERSARTKQLITELCERLDVPINELFRQVCMYLQGEQPSWKLHAQLTQFKEKGTVDSFFETVLREMHENTITITISPQN